MTDAVGPAPRPVLAAASVWMVGLGALAWIGVWAWVRREDMGAMPGTMGLGLAGFVAMWTLMMAAVMLPSVASVAGLYARTITERRAERLTAFAGGHLPLDGPIGTTGQWSLGSRNDQSASARPGGGPASAGRGQ